MQCAGCCARKQEICLPLRWRVRNSTRAGLEGEDGLGPLTVGARPEPGQSQAGARPERGR